MMMSKIAWPDNEKHAEIHLKIMPTARLLTVEASEGQWFA